MSRHSVGWRVSWLLVALLTGPAQAEPAIVLLDSTGKVVGPVFAENLVALTLFGQTVIVRAKPVGFVHDYPTYYFKEPNCAGPRYLSAGQIPNAAYLNDSGDAIDVPVGSVETFYRQSDLRYENGARSCFNVNLGPDDFSTVSSVPLGQIGFIPPFTVQMR